MRDRFRAGGELDDRLVGAYLGRTTVLLGYESVPMGNLKALLPRLRISCTALGDVLRG